MVHNPIKLAKKYFLFIYIAPFQLSDLQLQSTTNQDVVIEHICSVVLAVQHHPPVCMMYSDGIANVKYLY